MPLTRREFVLSLGGAGAMLASGRATMFATAPTLRVGLLDDGGPRAASLVAGGTLGAEEAARAASLFGLGVEHAVGRDAAALARTVQVLVGGAAGCDEASRVAEARGILFMNAACADDALRGAACRRHTFHVAASEAMRRDALALAPGAGAAAVALWHESLEAFGAAQLNDRFRRRFGRPMDSDAWAGWFAVKAAGEAFFRARAASVPALLARLERPDARFDGHKGRPLSFRAWDHQLRQPLYVVRGGRTTEVPARGGGAEALDRLGAAAASTRCRWNGR